MSDKIDVLKQYSRILGIQPDKNQDREALVERIIAELGDDLTEFDQALLEQDTIPDHTMGARWLMNDRQPLKMYATFSIPVNVTEEYYYLGNLAADRLGGKALALSLLGAGKTGPEILEVFLFDGFSFNQTLAILKQLGFRASASLYGNVGQVNQSVPLILVSKERRTKFWWQFWKWGSAETADLTMTPLKWALLPARIEELNLPLIEVMVQRTTPINS